MYGQTEYKGRTLKVAVVIGSVGVLGILMIVGSIVWRNLALTLLALPFLLAGLPILILGVVPKKVVLSRLKVEYWIMGRKRYEAYWGDVTRIRYGSTSVSRSEGVFSYLEIKARNGDLYLDSDAHFRNEVFVEMFKEIIGIAKDYANIELEKNG